MSRLSKEFCNVQNPALGAYIISKFAIGYVNVNYCFVPLPLVFIVLPMIFKSEIVDFIISTQKGSGLRGFSEKFIEKKNLKNDLVVQIQTQSQKYKLLTMESLQLAMAKNLIMLQDNAYLIPMEDIIKEFKCSSDEITRIAKAAEKLGIFCAQLSLAEVSQILKVRF